ncbi:hypothetical protein CROQUDRAFT_105965 [Cronartium quercuum f. sp. fusiforme G11]|uniref:Uncharacterized protein n=1 Tax=Cronartium quercuum f. sp. fusiforme G11 TaxID=708437 RepID=A0A9P6NMG9_9BASI|nr:hypothetical protein CROQUDRAFT_105965 [Cronartium quercuum f. sp. fusiforme G11]
MDVVDPSLKLSNFPSPIYCPGDLPSIWNPPSSSLLSSISRSSSITVKPNPNVNQQTPVFDPKPDLIHEPELTNFSNVFPSNMFPDRAIPTSTTFSDQLHPDSRLYRIKRQSSPKLENLPRDRWMDSLIRLLVMLVIQKSLEEVIDQKREE